MWKTITITALFIAFHICTVAQTTAGPEKEEELKVVYSSDIPKIDGEVIVSYPEIRPEYPGGEKVLQEHIQEELEYDQGAFWEGVEGKVITSFVVHKDGTISHIQVIKGLHPELDKAVVKLLMQMPKWEPGKISGEPIAVNYIFTVKYKIGKTKKIKGPPDF